MNTVRNYFAQRLGRRGTLLTLFGLGYGLYGVGLLLSPAPASRFGILGPMLTPVLNSDVVGWAWIVGSSVGFVVGLQPRKKSDGIGFVAVLIVLMTWTALFALSWTAWLVTGGVYGAPDTWINASVWGVFVGVVLVTAGWADPDIRGPVTGE